MAYPAGGAYGAGALDMVPHYGASPPRAPAPHYRGGGGFGGGGFGGGGDARQSEMERLRRQLDEMTYAIGATKEKLENGGEAPPAGAEGWAEEEYYEEEAGDEGPREVVVRIDPATLLIQEGPVMVKESGFLGRRNWKSRYMVFENTALVIFEETEDGKKLDEIPISPETVVEDGEDKEHKNPNVAFTFSITNPGAKKIELSVKTEDEIERWIASIQVVQQAIERAEHEARQPRVNRMERSMGVGAAPGLTEDEQAAEDAEAKEREEEELKEAALRYVAHGPGIAEAVRGEQSEFVIECRDEAGYPNAQLADPTALRAVLDSESLELDLPIEDLGDGTFLVTYTPPRQGDFELRVTAHGFPIYGSPFLLNVEPAPTAPLHCEVVGEGTTAAVVGRINSLRIIAKDQFDERRSVGGDKWEIEIQGPGKAYDIIDLDNGHYEVTYEVDLDHPDVAKARPGVVPTLTLHLTLVDDARCRRLTIDPARPYKRPVKGSPFHPIIVLDEPPAASSSTALVLASSAGGGPATASVLKRGITAQQLLALAAAERPATAAATASGGAVGPLARTVARSAVAGGGGGAGVDSPVGESLASPSSVMLGPAPTVPPSRITRGGGDDAAVLAASPDPARELFPPSAVRPSAHTAASAALAAPTLAVAGAPTSASALARPTASSSSSSSASSAGYSDDVVREREDLARDRDALARERDAVARERAELARERDALQRERERLRTQAEELQRQRTEVTSQLERVKRLGEQVEHDSEQLAQYARKLERDRDMLAEAQAQLRAQVAALNASAAAAAASSAATATAAAPASASTSSSPMNGTARAASVVAAPVTAPGSVVMAPVAAASPAPAPAPVVYAPAPAPVVLVASPAAPLSASRPATVVGSAGTRPTSVVGGGGGGYGTAPATVITSDGHSYYGGGGGGSGGGGGGGSLVGVDVSSLSGVARASEGAPAELFDPDVIELFEKHRRALHGLFQFYSQGSGSMTSQQFTQVMRDYDIIPTFSNSREIRAAFAEAARAHAGLGGGAAEASAAEGAGEEGSSDRRVTYAGFVEAVGRVALLALSKPAFRSLYPTPRHKVEVVLEMWALADPAKLQEIKDNPPKKKTAKKAQ